MVFDHGLSLVVPFKVPPELPMVAKTSILNFRKLGLTVCNAIAEILK
jgi:hypothetical protein